MTEPRDSASVERLCAASIPAARTDTTFPAGTIGVVSADLARYASFTMALCGVKYPYGTMIHWERGCDIVSGCNKLVRSLQGDWLWIMGDDHAFDTNLLIRLLGRLYGDGLDAVAPLCLSRQPPFPTVTGTLDEATRTIHVKPVAASGGLQRVDAVGSAGLLVRRYVFEKLQDPWFEAGSLVRSGLGEDWHFCLKMKEAGFGVWVDGDLRLGHTTSMTVWPYLDETGAGAELELDGTHRVRIQHIITGGGPA